MSKPDRHPANMPDLRKQVPDLIPYLRPGERVIEVRHVPTPPFPHLPDPNLELAKLCGVDSPAEIGKNGPAMASRTAQEAEGQGRFECRFGRDGLIAADNVMAKYPLLARATLLDYAARLGMRYNERGEEEFGRMFHEDRRPDDPVAQPITDERGWEWPFYGSVDATPLFVNILYRYLQVAPEGTDFLNATYKGRDGQRHTMAEALLYATQWIIGRVNRNPEGFLEYWPMFPESHRNQIMEDSWDSRFHSDGQLANCHQGVVATEVQGYTYDALMHASEILSRQPALSRYCRHMANRLKRNVFVHLWDKDLKCFVPGADRDEQGNLRPLRVCKTIPAFILNSRLLKEPRSAKRESMLRGFVATLFSPKLLATGGLRSLAVGEPRFMPGAYHNGSVWCMQTFEVAQGLRRRGMVRLAHELEERVVACVEQTRLYPEYVRGDTEPGIRLNERKVTTWDGQDQQENNREEPPQQIQLWTLTAYMAIVAQRTCDQSSKPAPPSAWEQKVLGRI